MRRLVLARHDADFNLLEAGFVQPAVQIALGKTRPAVAVELLRLVEVVLEQIENQNLPAAPQNFMRAAKWPGPARPRDATPGSKSPGPRCRHQSAGSANRPAGIPDFFCPFFFAFAAPNATIFSELSTAMTFLQRRASSSLNKPSPAPRSATTSGGRIRSSKCPKACHERPGP